jgi:ribosome silencing factor RsfS/YbeB/iojap
MEGLERALIRIANSAYREWGILGAIGAFIGGIALLLVIRFLIAVWKQRREVGEWIVSKYRGNPRLQLWTANYTKRISQDARTAAIYSIVCAVVLVIAALSDWPYFMYALLRLFICCSSAYLALKLYSRHRVPLAWLFGAIGVLFNPILPVKMARSDWETTNVIIAVVFFAVCVYLVWDSLFRRRVREPRHTAEAVLAAGTLCDEMNGLDTRILELDPTDSSLSDFFVVTSATDRRQALVIADVVKRQLLSDYGLNATVEGRNGDWMLLDYADFVVHIFVAEMRNFYDLERLRKRAISFTLPEFGKVVKMRLHNS